MSLVATMPSKVWPEVILSNPHIFLRDDDEGLWVVCTRSKVSGKETRIVSRAAFTVGRWKDHCLNKSHQCNCDSVSKKNQVAMNSFLGCVKSWKSKIRTKDTSLPAEYEEPISNKTRSVRSCQGIPPETNKGEVKDYLFIFEKYAAVPITTTSAYVLAVYDSCPTLVSIDCTNNGAKHPKVPGLRCLNCDSIVGKPSGPP